MVSIGIVVKQPKGTETKSRNIKRTVENVHQK